MWPVLVAVAAVPLGKPRKQSVLQCSFFPSASEEMKSFIAFCLGSIYDALAMSGFPGISYQPKACGFPNLMNVLTRGEAVSGRSQWPGTG